jgi:protein-S-isoprenylcysteine O-methyltransferase Ste14
MTFEATRTFNFITSFELRGRSRSRCFDARLPRRELSLTGEPISTLLLLGGNALAVLVPVQLGRSFSIMAEARRLVTSGVYRWVRHPLYLAEELAVIGIVL